MTDWQAPQGQWTAYGDWGNKPRRPRSPRSRAKGQGKQPQAGKATVHTPAAGPAAPKAEQLPKPPARAAIPGPTPSTKDAASSSASSEDRQALDKLLQALSADESALSPQLRELLDQHRQTDTRVEAKAMHRVVAQKAAAKKELNKLRTARGNYLQAWSSYLDQVVDALQKQIQEHGETMADYQAKEGQWEASLQEATTTLAKLAKEDVESVSDDEDVEKMMDASDAKADEAALAEVQAQCAAEKAAAKNESLIAALQQARVQAGDALRQDQARERTPRRKQSTGEPTSADPGKAS